MSVVIKNKCLELYYSHTSVFVKAGLCAAQMGLNCLCPLRHSGFSSICVPPGQKSTAAHWNPTAKQPTRAHVPAQLHHAQHVLQQHFTDLQDVLHGSTHLNVHPLSTLFPKVRAGVVAKEIFPL